MKIRGFRYITQCELANSNNNKCKLCTKIQRILFQEIHTYKNQLKYSAVGRHPNSLW